MSFLQHLWQEVLRPTAIILSKNSTGSFNRDQQKNSTITRNLSENSAGLVNGEAKMHSNQSNILVQSHLTYVWVSPPHWVATTGHHEPGWFRRVRILNRMAMKLNKLRSHKPEDFGNVYWVPGHLRPFHTCRIGCSEKDQKISLKTPAWWTPSVQIHGITIQWLKSEGPDGEIVAGSNVGYGFHYKHFYKAFLETRVNLRAPWSLLNGQLQPCWDVVALQHLCWTVRLLVSYLLPANSAGNA